MWQFIITVLFAWIVYRGSAPYWGETVYSKKKQPKYRQLVNGERVRPPLEIYNSKSAAVQGGLDAVDLILGNRTPAGHRRTTPGA